jgi:glycerate 2-kinase
VRDLSTLRRILTKSYRAGLHAVSAPIALARHVEHDHEGLRVGGRGIPSNSRLFVLAAGKAAAAMAEAFEGLASERIHDGLVITKDGHADGFALQRFRVLEAAHPVPDARSEAAAEAADQFVARTREDDVLVVLLSGGASSLLSAPAPGLEIADLRDANAWLLACGADIEEVNTVRKHLSRLSGGRLGAAARAERIEVLAISDVPGDRPDVIASGPFTADPTRFEDALAIVEARGTRVPISERVSDHLRAGVAGSHEETPKPGDDRLAAVRFSVIADNRQAAAAAASVLADAGAQVSLETQLLDGEARDAAVRFVNRALELPGSSPRALVAGGETTVTLRGDGMGGRNQEFALSAAVALADFDGEALLLAAGSDGSDGPTPAAGAWADDQTVVRARGHGREPLAFLEANDSFHFFEAEGGLFTTGPSGTNVMDLVLIWLGETGGNAKGE